MDSASSLGVIKPSEHRLNNRFTKYGVIMGRTASDQSRLADLRPPVALRVHIFWRRPWRRNPNLTLAGPDLAALLCSRVCHDVISPVGAINNGLELLDEGRCGCRAMDLIRTSALNASVRLKFARLAFGASGSVGAIDRHGRGRKGRKGFRAR